MLLLGILQHHLDIECQIQQANAVCCDNHHIFVIHCGPSVLSVYNWKAVHQHDFNRNQLGIRPEDNLWAIGAIDEDIIAIAVGGTNSVDSLHCYKMI